MMEQPESRKDEQYPLLKENSGVSDSVRQPIPAQTPSWTVSCAPKQSWLRRHWSECISASWLTLVLLGMSFLTFYAFGMGAYRRLPTLNKYNNVKPASNVYFHHVIQRGSQLPFALYSPYLSSMTFTYPNLRFNVLFLVDDAMRSTYYIPRHARLYNGLLGYQNKDAKDDILKQEAKEFEKRHANVNITIVALSKYMAMTPLRFKWRTIPLSYLTFYTRVFSVWQYGGIGMDLTTYNNRFCNNIHLDQRVHEILKNHNEGLPVTDYNILLRVIDEEEDSCFKTVKQMLNDTISMFNSVFSFGDSLLMNQKLLPSDEMPAIRTQRARRNINNNIPEIKIPVDKSSTETNIATEVFDDTLDILNETLDDKEDSLKKNYSFYDLLKAEVPQTTVGQLNLTTSNATLKATPENKINVTVKHNNSNDDSKGNPGLLVYDFSIMSNNIGRFLMREPLWPPFIPPSFVLNAESEMIRNTNKKRNSNTTAQLAVATDGLFIAAADKMHPFLGMLITAGFQSMRPEFAIQDTIQTQCSGVNKNAAYCNIYEL